MLSAFAFLLAGSAANSRVDAIFGRMTAQGVPGLTYAIVRDGRVVQTNSFGYANLEDRSKAHRETVYEIGSMTKQFTAACVLMLNRASPRAEAAEAAVRSAAAPQAQVRTIECDLQSFESVRAAAAALAVHAPGGVDVLLLNAAVMKCVVARSAATCTTAEACRVLPQRAASVPATARHCCAPLPCTAPGPFFGTCV